MGSKNATDSDGEKKRVTYYEILGIKEDSTEKDIREAYVKLSKTCHPDSNPDDKNLHDKFVRVQEAYSALSKQDSRRNYDLSLLYYRRSRYSLRGPGKTIITPDTKEYYHKPWRDETIWEMRDRSKDGPVDPESYYGIKGVKRVSNKVIAGLACGLLAIGAVIHYTAFKHSATFTVNQLDKKDRRLALSYNGVREIAEQNGTERQAALFLHNFEEQGVRWSSNES